MYLQESSEFILPVDPIFHLYILKKPNGYIKKDDPKAGDV